ncbi:MAG: DUF1844 domain-containing protein [Terracidiphilus sp.]|jgi:hypothetical protein
MSDTPKFTVIDRRKIKANEEQENQQASATQAEAASAPTEPSAGPQLVVNEHKSESRAEAPSSAASEPSAGAESELPPAPTAKESREQKVAYEASAQRLEDIVRAQNPGAGPQPPVTFEHLVQQFYVSAMIQMGAGAQEGQRPRVDILGARTTIDLLGVLEEKTRGNLTEAEKTTLETVLYEVRMAFLELSSMISLQAMQPPQPPPPQGKR